MPRIHRVLGLAILLANVGVAAGQTQPSPAFCASREGCDLKIGKLSLHVTAVTSGSSVKMSQEAFVDISKFSASLDGQNTIDLNAIKSVTSVPSSNLLPVNTLATAINHLGRGVVAQVSSDQSNRLELMLRTTSANVQKSLVISGISPKIATPKSGANNPDSSEKSEKEISLPIEATTWRNFVLSLSDESISYLKDQTKVTIRLYDGTIHTLYPGHGTKKYSWTYVSDRGPLDMGRLLVVRVQSVAPPAPDQRCPNLPSEVDLRATHSIPCGPTCPSDWFAQSQDHDPDSYGNFCAAEYVIVRRSEGSDDSTASGTNPDELVVAMKTTSDGKLEVKQALLAGGNYVIDDRISISDVGITGDPIVIDSGAEPWNIEWFGSKAGCRPPPHKPPFYNFALVQTPRHLRTVEKDNGIVVGAAKIFDVLQLRRMLNDAANQLAGLSVFNGSQISSAVGNLQGVSRDTSYFSAQVTTSPTPGISQSSSTGVVAPNTTQTTTPGGPTVVTLQCPDGSLPTIGSGTTLGGCATVPITGTLANVPAYAPVTNSGSGSGFQGTLTTTPASSTIANTGSTTTTQNGTTTTTPSVSGVAPSALQATPLNAPSNVGQGSADVLAEQVQLNAQLISLRLLLQGALSDQFLTKNSTAVGIRRQTTLGFTVNLDPPPQFKHAVAEVRVIISPPGSLDPSENSVSLMTLLPAEKTYNVAKVTSHQSAYSAGAVVEPVSFGASTGKSKDRLYLVKDTDTVALQFRPQALPIGAPFPLSLHNKLKATFGFEDFGSCSLDDGQVADNALVFGWQFRPVLGEDYVQVGQRQVFAQLALPIGLRGHYTPDVTVQTRWRDYDPKSQVVGAVFTETCSSTTDESGVMLTTETGVDDMNMFDLGAGQVALRADGQFYSSSLGVIAGANTLAPRLYDGSRLEIDAAAHDLLEAGDLAVIDPNGQTKPFGISPILGKSCGIINASMTAVPYPDGNSRATVTINLGSDFNVNSAADKPPHPLIAIGTAIFGLKETPFLDKGGLCLTYTDSTTNATGTLCQYNFIAPTTTLRNAQTFLVRDPTWIGFSKTDAIQFAPSFTSMAVSSSSKTQQPPGAAAANGSNSTTTTYTINGYDFNRITLRCAEGRNSLNPCLRVFAGNNELPLNLIGFEIQSDNVATMILRPDQVGNAKSIRFQIDWSKNDPRSRLDWAVTLPKADSSKPTPSPAFLRVGDSQRVTYSGGDLCQTTKVYTVTFEVYTLPSNCNETGSLEVTVTTNVTGLFGHKELLLSSAGVPVTSGGSQVTLPIDVLRQ